jgi:hypothetical protein
VAQLVEQHEQKHQQQVHHSPQCTPPVPRLVEQPQRCGGNRR